MVLRTHIIIGLIILVDLGFALTMWLTMSFLAAVLTLAISGLVSLALIDLLWSCQSRPISEITQLLNESEGDTIVPVNDCDL